MTLYYCLEASRLKVYQISICIYYENHCIPFFFLQIFKVLFINLNLGALRHFIPSIDNAVVIYLEKTIRESKKKNQNTEIAFSTCM